MEILSSFIHPQVVPNLYEFLSSAEHKRRYFEECQYNQQLWASLTSIVFFLHTMAVNGDYQLCGYLHSSKYLHFFDELGFYNIKTQIKPSRSCHTQKSPVGCSVNLSTAGQLLLLNKMFTLLHSKTE